jgi:hypothetical protein
VNLLRQQPLDVLELPLCEAPREHGEHGARRPVGIDLVIAVELLRDQRQEGFGIPRLHRLPARIPAFVVETSHRHRQLRCKLRYLLDGEPVAQGVQCCTQRLVRFAPLLETHLRCLTRSSLMRVNLPSATGVLHGLSASQAQRRSSPVTAH